MKRLPISTLVNLLFDHQARPDGKPYTNTEVAHAIGVSDAWISLLRKGERTNPQYDALIGLIDFFGVSSAYLDASDEREAIHLIRDGVEPSIMLRSPCGSDLSHEAILQLEKLAEYVVKHENARQSGNVLPPLPLDDSDEFN